MDTETTDTEKKVPFIAKLRGGRPTLAHEDSKKYSRKEKHKKKPEEYPEIDFRVC